MTIDLLGKSHPIVIPPRHAERHELCVGYSQNHTRGSAAILGMCAPSLWAGKEKGGVGAQAFTYKSCGYDVGEYGVRCWELLRAAGLTESDFIAAASPVFVELANLTLPNAAEVKEQVDFSAAGGGA